MTSTTKRIIAIIFIFCSILSLVALGFWQLHRLDKKEQLQSTLHSNLKSTPLELRKLNIEPGAIEHFYKKIKMRGVFLPSKDIYLYASKLESPEKNSYYLLSTFVSDTGKKFLVVRGWFPYSKLDLIKSKNFASAVPEEITGVILPSEKKQFFTPETNPNSRVWFALDIKNIADAMKVNLEDFYILSVDQKQISKIVRPVNYQRLLRVRNKHLEYAITWFSLAAALIVVCAVYVRKMQKTS